MGQRRWHGGRTLASLSQGREFESSGHYCHYHSQKEHCYVDGGAVVLVGGSGVYGSAYSNVIIHGNAAVAGAAALVDNSAVVDVSAKRCCSCLS